RRPVRKSGWMSAKAGGRRNAQNENAKQAVGKTGIGGLPVFPASSGGAKGPLACMVPGRRPHSFGAWLRKGLFYCRSGAASSGDSLYWHRSQGRGVGSGETRH